MIKITVSGDQEISAKFSDAPKIIKQSIRSAMTRTMKKIEKDLESASANEFDIPKNVLAKYRVKSRRVGTNGLVWMGYNQIKATYVAQMPKQGSGYGTARQEDWGVSIRSYLFQGSFLQKMPSGHKGVFNRQGEKIKLKRGSYRPIAQQIVEQKVSLLKAPILAAQVRERASEYYQQELATQLANKLSK